MQMCYSLHKFDLHYFVSMISILYEYDLRTLYYVLYECDLRDAKCGFWRSLHNDFEFAGGSFDWVGGQGLGRWSSRQVGENWEVGDERWGWEAPKAIEWKDFSLFAACPFWRNPQEGQKVPSRQLGLGTCLKGGSCLHGWAVAHLQLWDRDPVAHIETRPAWDSKIGQGRLLVRGAIEQDRVHNGNGEGAKCKVS